MRKENLVNPELVLYKATMNAMSALGLTTEEKTAALGIDQSAMHELDQSQAIPVAHSTGQRALDIIRIYEKLSLLNGNDHEWISHFMHTSNTLVGCIPVECFAEPHGMGLKRILRVLCRVTRSS